MPQRKSTPTGKSPAGKSAAGGAGSAAGKRPGGAGAAGKATTKTTTTTKTAAKPAGKSAAGSRPPVRKPGKSIVNQKQRPWGLIAAATAVVLFAVAIVVVVVVTRKDSGTTTGSGSTTKGGQAVDKNDPYRQPALPAAMKINGVTYRVQAEHQHVNGVIKYDTSPPTGGNHSQIWADCTGKVYDHQIANENAVHMLEHGAVWITYNPKTLPASELPALKKYVAGVDRTALSPYAGLKTPISLQAWGYQLFVKSASDPRIAQFIATLKYNPKTTPENASCSDPYFKASDSRPGHPQDNA
jgi:hypothetical protein